MKTQPKKFELHQGILKIADKEISLPSSVEKAIEIDSLIIVRLLIGEYQDNRNIFAFDLKGKQLWQIQGSPYGGEGRSNPFVRLWVSEQGDLIAGDFIGVDFIVNPKDGTLIKDIAFNRF